jgi:SAM-dependent methyltransferase
VNPGDGPLDAERVRDDFRLPRMVAHYARAARSIGLWRSEAIVFERFLPRDRPILELGTGAGRVALALAESGWGPIEAVDYSPELIDAAVEIAGERGVGNIAWQVADARALPFQDKRFAAAIFAFNGLMQVPGRRQRQAALCEIARVCEPGAVFLFTTHDRDLDSREAWQAERERWDGGSQDACLREFGDRRFEDESGPVFMHVPDRNEILEDLASCGWMHLWDERRRALASEPAAVLEFSDECRFWVARRTA